MLSLELLNNSLIDSLNDLVPIKFSKYFKLLNEL